MDLFDLIEKEEVKEKLKECLHKKEKKTITIWSDAPELGERMTWTCEICGRIRGRC